MAEKKIKANIVIEMMGRPKEHLEETMKKFLEVLDAEKGVKVLNKNIREPKIIEGKDKEGKPLEIPENQKLFSTFTEAEVEVDNIMLFMGMCFRYMPSHVEIFEPREFSLNDFDMNSLMNELISKLHNYDAIAKAALAQNQILSNKLQMILKKYKEKKEKD